MQNKSTFSVKQHWQDDSSGPEKMVSTRYVGAKKKAINEMYLTNKLHKNIKNYYSEVDYNNVFDVHIDNIIVVDTAYTMSTSFLF